MTAKHFLFPALLLVSVAVLSLQIDQALSWQHQFALAFTPVKAESFADFNFVYAQLPRIIMTLLVGATLGFVGSLMQQLTQNHLTSPFTLGTSSGAWLALVLLSVFLPDSLPDFSALAAMAGALIAFIFILLITGLNNITGLPLVISGMVINILFGSLATAVILLNQQFAQNVFMWGAGDLAQNGWDWVLWLLPRLTVALPLLIVAPRILLLLRLGQEGATARGLPVIPVFLLLMVSGIWLVSAAITAVGLIGFIGLLTPNIARALGARTAKEELYASLLLGALLLMVTDIISVTLSQWLGQLIPSGVTTAAIGAPALIWFNRKKLKAQDSIAVRLPNSRSQISLFSVLLLFTLLVTVVLLYLYAQPDEQVWQFALSSDYQWALRWPRALTALSAGAGLAVAGVILQRLLYNPLASPDILGVSSGATFALVFATLFLGQSLAATHWVTAMAGSILVLGLLLILGRRNQYAPSGMILSGIALSALLQALIQFCLAKGNQDSYEIMQWMAGSTYHVTHTRSLLLFSFVAMLMIAALGTSRWLTLISISRSFATARGVNPQISSLVLLSIVALLCAVVTATLGPVSFVGLVAPHMAMMLGAQTVKKQLLLSALIGSTALLWSDWLGQVILYPHQIAAGTLVAIVGALYFLALLTLQRCKK